MTVLHRLLLLLCLPLCASALATPSIPDKTPARSASHPAPTTKPARNTRPARPAKPLTAPIPTLRVRQLSELPAAARRDLHRNAALPERGEAQPLRLPDLDCARPLNPSGQIPPCLGLTRQTAPSELRLRFEVSRSIIGAPQGPLFPPCRQGLREPCATPLSDLQSDQEKLADMLNQGKRTPQANLGLELSF